MKKFALIFVLLFIIPFSLIGCSEKEETRINEYNLVLQYDDENSTLTGEETIKYVNNSDNAFSSLLFHLYPNAFREGAKFPPVADHDDAYPHGESYGDIYINAVQCKGDNLEFEITGQDLNILKVHLPSQIYPDEQITININFSTKLAKINHRLGKGDNAINFGNFYPIACVYEDGVGFMTSPYSSSGDPFYSDVANYKVKILYPEKYILASSGVQDKTLTSNGTKSSYITGNKIRDFCFVLSDKFNVLETTVDGIKILYYYYLDNNSKQSLEVSAKSVHTYNELFGNYPYKTLSVVETNFVHGGMEYPNLVMISDESGAEYNYVIAHEIAHQWWYGVVGNNQYSHAWQDEGLTDYSSLLFFRENNEYNINFDDLIDGATRSYKIFVETYDMVGAKANTVMDRDLPQFSDENEYVVCTYTKGVLFFNTLHETLGEKKFFKALKTYYKEFSFKNAQPADMVAVFERCAGYSLEGIFKNWLEGKVKIF